MREEGVWGRGEGCGDFCVLPWPLRLGHDSSPTDVMPFCLLWL